MNRVGRISKKSSFIKKDLNAWLMMLPMLVLIYFIVVRPILVGFGYSFFNMRGYELTSFAGLSNYIDVVSDSQFWKMLGNTVQYVLWSLVIGFPLPVIMAVLLNELVHGKAFFRFAMYFPAIVPGILTSLIWYYMYLPDQSGLLNMLFSFVGLGPFPFLQSKTAVIPMIVTSMTWGFGSTMVMYIASLQSVNQELYDAVRIDGGGFFRRVWHISLPHMSSMILLMLVRQIIGVFQVLEQPMVMTGGGPNNASLTIGLQIYRYAFGDFKIAHSLALGMIAFVILIGLTFLYVKMEEKLEA